MKLKNTPLNHSYFSHVFSLHPFLCKLYHQLHTKWSRAEQSPFYTKKTTAKYTLSVWLMICRLLFERTALYCISWQILGVSMLATPRSPIEPEWKSWSSTDFYVPYPDFGTYVHTFVEMKMSFSQKISLSCSIFEILNYHWRTFNPFFVHRLSIFCPSLVHFLSIWTHCPYGLEKWIFSR